jgi:regulatory protein
VEKPKHNPEGVALRLLAQRDHSRKELRQKIIAKDYPPAEVDEVLERLAGKGYLDDARYARRWAVHLGKDRMLGPGCIAQKLLQKGISPHLVDEAVVDGERDFPATERLKILLQKKLRARTPADLSPLEIKKLSRFFYQRGFSWGDIQDIFHRVGGFTEE